MHFLEASDKNFVVSRSQERCNGMKNGGVCETKPRRRGGGEFATEARSAASARGRRGAGTDVCPLSGATAPDAGQEAGMGVGACRRAGLAPSRGLCAPGGLLSPAGVGVQVAWPGPWASAARSRGPYRRRGPPSLKGQLRRLLTEPGGGGALRPLNESCRGHFTTQCWTPNPGGSRNTFQSRKRASSETGPVKRGEGPPQGRPALSRLRWGRAGRPGPAPHSLHAAGLRRAGRRGGPGAASPALPCCFWGLQRGPGLAPLGPLGPRQGHQPRQLL